MTRASKTDEEWTIMRYFTEKYAELPSGKLVKSESPDFLLKVGRRYTIGIELTQLETEGEDIRSVGKLNDFLKEAIARKEKKVASYNSRLPDELWLVIFTSTLALPVNTPVEDHLERFKSDSGFTRLFLLDLFRGKVFVLK